MEDARCDVAQIKLALGQSDETQRPHHQERQAEGGRDPRLGDVSHDEIKHEGRRHHGDHAEQNCAPGE